MATSFLYWFEESFRLEYSLFKLLLISAIQKEMANNGLFYVGFIYEDSIANWLVDILHCKSH